MDHFLHQVENIVSNHFQEKLKITQPVVLKDWERNRVVRCTVEPHHKIRSVIVKQIKQNEACGFSEWASLQFLSGIETLAETHPQFYGGDIDARLFVMEDLGTMGSLADALDQGHPPAIKQILCRLSQQMARLVEETQGNQKRFEVIRAALPEHQAVGRRAEGQRWLIGRKKLGQWFEALRIETPIGFERSFHSVAAAYVSPDVWLAFSHGDPAPTNNYIVGTNVRLIDFEYGAFRHALYDLSAWNILCPLPKTWVQLMIDCFQQQIAPQIPEFGEEKAFKEAWAMMCAYRSLALMTWLPVTIITIDRSWVGNWSMREALISTLIRLYDATIEIPTLAALAALSEMLLQTLQRRWPNVGNGAIKWGNSILEEGIDNAKSRDNLRDHRRGYVSSGQDDS